MEQRYISLVKSEIPRSQRLPLRAEAYCPECGDRMQVVLAGEIYICSVCGSHQATPREVDILQKAA